MWSNHRSNSSRLNPNILQQFGHSRWSNCSTVLWRPFEDGLETVGWKSDRGRGLFPLNCTCKLFAEVAPCQVWKSSNRGTDLSNPVTCSSIWILGGLMSFSTRLPLWSPRAIRPWSKDTKQINTLNNCHSICLSKFFKDAPISAHFQGWWHADNNI